jgi:hypothetical protein
MIKNMKKKRVVRWLLLFAAFGIALFIGSHLLHMGGWGHRNMAVWQKGGSQMQAFQHGRFHNGFRQGHFNGRHGIRHFAGGHGIFRVGSIIASLVILTIGWILRKSAKGNLWLKWGGWLLIGIGTVMLISRVVPLVFFIIIGIVLWRFLVKGKKKHKVETPVADYIVDSVTPLSTKTGDMLDEWERKLSKEDK